MWDPAFSQKSLAQYEPRIKEHIKMLVEQFERRVGGESGSCKLTLNGQRVSDYLVQK